LPGSLGRAGKFDRVVETASVHCPQLAADALLFQVFIFRRGQAAVEKHKVKRRSDPRNGGDDVHPTQQ